MAVVVAEIRLRSDEPNPLGGLFGSGSENGCTGAMFGHCSSDVRRGATNLNTVRRYPQDHVHHVIPKLRNFHVPKALNIMFVNSAVYWPITSGLLLL